MSAEMTTAIGEAESKSADIAGNHLGIIIDQLNLLIRTQRREDSLGLREEIAVLSWVLSSDNPSRRARDYFDYRDVTMRQEKRMVSKREVAEALNWPIPFPM